MAYAREQTRKRAMFKWCSDSHMGVFIYFPITMNTVVSFLCKYWNAEFAAAFPKTIG